MPTDEERFALWQKLDAKYTALVAWEQKFNMTVPANQRPLYAGQLRSVQAEAEQLLAKMTFLLDGAPMAFPSAEQIAALQQATGELAVATANGNDANSLIAGLGTILSTWPVP